VQASFPIATATWSENRPAVAWDGTTFVVAWLDDSNGGSVRAARVATTGTVLDVGGVPVADGESAPSQYFEQAQLEIASTANGQTLVAWRNLSGLVVARRL
jgi:hypothetical protein